MYSSTSPGEMELTSVGGLRRRGFADLSLFDEDDVENDAEDKAEDGDDSAVKESRFKVERVTPLPIRKAYGLQT